MGTHATTRIATENDYIEHHTRWDGFPTEIAYAINHSISRWKQSVIILKEKLKDHDSAILQEWIADLEDFLNKSESNLTLEAASVMLCNRSFTAHHILPFSAPDNLLSYWGKGNPDLTAFIKDNKFDFKTHYEESEDYEDDSLDSVEQEIEIPNGAIDSISVIPKRISSEYKVARVYNNSDTSGSPDYVDIKYKDISEIDLVKKIIRLPQLMRDIYSVIKAPISVQYDNMNTYNLPIFSLVNKLGYFYTPTKNYSRFRSRYDNEKDTARTSKGREQDKLSVLDDIRSLIPFDFSIENVSIHLSLATMNKVAPLTEAERLSDYPISLFIVVGQDSRLSKLYASIPELNYDSHISVLDECMNEIKEHEIKYKTQHNLSIENLNIGEYLHGTDVEGKPFIGFNYESNLVDLMLDEYDIELQNKN